MIFLKIIFDESILTTSFNMKGLLNLKNKIAFFISKVVILRLSIELKIKLYIISSITLGKYPINFCKILTYHYDRLNVRLDFG